VHNEMNLLKDESGRSGEMNRKFISMKDNAHRKKNAIDGFSKRGKLAIWQD